MPSKLFAAWDTGSLRPVRVVKSETFRHATLFAVLFLALAGILIGAVLWMVQGRQEQSIRRANDADVATVINAFRDEGVDEAVEVIRQRVGSPKYKRIVATDYYMLLTNADGTELAGNVTGLPPRLGIFTTTLDRSHFPDWLESTPGTRRHKSVNVLGRRVEITAGIYFYVGRNTEEVTATRRSILAAFVWIALGASIVAVLAGIFLGTRFTRRVDAIAQTCGDIIAGRLDERIALSGRGDEWDRLGSAINEMLNRIAVLMENLRQMSSDVAHDLRTPLTRMRNRLEEARLKSPSPSDNAAAIAAAIEDSDHLLAMFAALLRISQVESGTRLSGFSEVSLSDLGEKVFEMYLPVAEDYQLSFSRRIETGVMVHGDAELLLQMLTNVVENAIRHTPKQTRIQLIVATVEGQPTASIEDNGPGIPADERDKVLRRFYRLSTSRSTAGHGLGLSLVAAVAQLHHAAVTLSDAGPGLRVEMRFPRVALN